MKTDKTYLSRRKFIVKSATAALGTAIVSPTLFSAPTISAHYKKPNSIVNGVQIGLITYSFRSMPDQSAEATLKYVLDTGINAIELMGEPAEMYAGKPANPIDRRAYFGLRRAKHDGTDWSDAKQKELDAMQVAAEVYNKVVAEWRAKVAMDKFEELRKMYNDAGVSIYAFKPNAFGKNNTDAEIIWGMKAANALGASHITLEHPSDDAHTLKLGAMAEEHDMYVGYHGHEQQTPTFWDTALEQSANNALNIDLGHYVAAGNTDPLDILKAKHQHIMSMHTKDRQNPANGKKNVVWGSGDTPIADALRLMRDNNYTFPATIELEYDIPEDSDAVQEVKKCLEFCKEALEQ